MATNLTETFVHLPQTAEEQNQVLLNDDYGKYYPTDPRNLNLQSNFGPMIPEQIAYLQPTAKDTPVEIIRDRFLRDIYVFVKALLPKDRVLDCRRRYFSHMAPSSLLKDGSDPVDGIFSEKDTRKFLPPGNLRRLFGLQNDAESDQYLELMISAHEAPFYLDFCTTEELRPFIRKFAGWRDITMLQRTMLRAFVPDSELTPVHFDQMYLRASPPISLTAWVPVGDVSLEAGGLMTEAEFGRNAGDLTDEERVSAFNKNMNDGGFLSRDTVSYGKGEDRRWLITEYEAGDVIFHDPFLVHASCKNKDPERRIRLATDLRFVDANQAYDQRWMKVWRPLDGL
ncbi:phytanoyl-CoA dioxygenase family protein [Aspergillus aculeatinus CBS 121060]|uniref:Uncharacterized protein n=1 Tax=Aspergillus aculeatinus CBS 121060 TaxID=1448322 RepID=A0ACD1HQ35_9EURO|nr:hypothetical protein BO66DRAFT_407469 [Aspergillus aculeatinus CBS 121060]RAH75681.1 hypothetical protein BO66DRAFT_407469 [Aspergillus aculeatinus CBS 121060]